MIEFTFLCICLFVTPIVVLNKTQQLQNNTIKHNGYHNNKGNFCALYSVEQTRSSDSFRLWGGGVSASYKYLKAFKLDPDWRP